MGMDIEAWREGFGRDLMVQLAVPRGLIHE